MVNERRRRNKKRYLLEDRFADARAAGAVNGTLATDGHSLRTVVDTYAATELIVNGGFETVTAAGPPANFGTWTEAVSDGNIEAATGAGEFHGGATACKLTAGAGVNTNIFQNWGAIPSKVYNITVWARGDGTYSGNYRIWDSSNGAWLTPLTTLGVTGTTFAQVSISITAPAGGASLRIMFWCPTTAGGICYVDDVSVLPTTGLLSIT